MKLTTDQIIAKYENFFKGGSGYTFQVEVDDFNALVEYISKMESRILKVHQKATEQINKLEKEIAVNSVAWDKMNDDFERIYNERNELRVEVEKWKRSEAVAVNLLNKYTKELLELKEERKGFKEFLKYSFDIDRPSDALIEGLLARNEKLEMQNNELDSYYNHIITDLKRELNIQKELSAYDSDIGNQKDIFINGLKEEIEELKGDTEISIKQDEFIKLNEKPLEGFREVKWSVNDEYEHHTLTIKDGYGKSVTLFNKEIDKLYEVLRGVLFNKC